MMVLHLASIRGNKPSAGTGRLLGSRTGELHGPDEKARSQEGRRRATRGRNLTRNASFARPRLKRQTLGSTRTTHCWLVSSVGEKESYFWYLEIGQLCCAAVLNKRTLNKVDQGDYYGWPPAVCIARGLVVAVRGLRAYERSVEKNLVSLFADIFEIMIGGSNLHTSHR